MKQAGPVIASEVTNQARSAGAAAKALAFLKRRRPTDGLGELEALEKERRVEILETLQELCGLLETGGPAAWALRVEGQTEAGIGPQAREDVLGYMLLGKNTGRWFVTLDAEGWRSLSGYGRALAKQTGREWWAESPACVAQLIGVLSAGMRGPAAVTPV